MLRAPSSDENQGGRVRCDRDRPCSLGFFLGILAICAAPALAEPHDPLISLATGAEVEGLEESFGTESFGSISTHAATGVEASQPIDDQLEVLRLKSSEVEYLGTLGLRARTPRASRHDGWFDLGTKLGEERQSVALEASYAGREGPWSDWSFRNLFFWDREEDDATSRQGLLYTRWRPRLGTGDWRLDARANLDLSRTDEVELSDLIALGDSLEIPDSTGSSWLSFLNYQKVAVRLGLASSGLNSAALWLDLKRKWVVDDGPGSYLSGTLGSSLGRFFGSGAMFDLDLEVQRRAYEEATSSLSSFWEADLLGRFSSGFAPLRWKAQLAFNGIRYDPEAPIDSLASINDDHFEVRTDILIERAFIDLLSPDLTERTLQECTLGCGPLVEVLEYRGGVGSALTLGGDIELSLRGANWWVQNSFEGGHRNYREEEDGERLTLSSFGLSLTQSDYAYLCWSLLCGGEIPLRRRWVSHLALHAIEWEGYASLDQEWHSVVADDARLFSYSFAIRCRWDLGGSQASD